MQSIPTKACVKCGRTITWRRKWKRDWDRVMYCSAKCRTEKLGEVDHALERAILRLLDTRRGRTICPSEAARAVDPERWRALMERSREAARRLVARDQVVITQDGRVVDGSTAKGPIRVKRV